MTAPIDTAHVLIVPDLSQFESRVETGVDVAFRGAEGVVDDVISAMERQFNELAAEISADFQTIAADASTSFDEMASASIAGTDLMTETFAVMGARVDAIFEEIQQSADRDLDQVATKAVETSGAVGSAFGKLAGIASLGATGVAAGLGALTFFGLKSAASLEQVNIAFDSLTGSVTAGNAQFKALQQFAAATPFEFKDLTTAAQRFDAFSASIGQSQQQLIPFLTTIGNLVSETGGGAQALDSISLALGQTASQGKITLGNLNQINNAIPGFSSVAALAAVRGESTAQVMQEISAGSIDAKTGINQLLQGMQQFPGAAGAMDKQAETLLGVFSTFSDTVSQALSNAFQPVIPAIKNSLTQITPIIGDAVNQLAPALGTILAGVLPVLGQLVTGLAQILTPLLTALGPAIKPIGDAFAALGPAIGEVVTALVPLIPLFASIIGTVGQTLAQVLITLAPELASLAPNFVILANALLPLVPLLGQMLVLLLQVASPLTALVGTLADHVTTFQTIVVALLAIGALVKVFDAYKAVVSGIEGATKLWTAAQLALDAAMDANPVGLVVVAIAALAAGIVLLATKTQFFQDTWMVLWAWMKIAAAWFAGPFVDFFKDIGAWFAGPFLVPFKVVGAWFSGPFVDFFKAIGAWFSGPFAGFFVSIGKTIAGLPGKITGVFSGALTWLEDAGKNVIMGLIHGIEGAVGDAITAAENAMKSVIKGAESILHISSPSKVFMEIGAQVVAGFAGGVDENAHQGVASVANMLGSTVVTAASTPAGGSAGGAGAAPLFGPGSIVVNLGAGATASQAYSAGLAVGQGVSDALQQLNVNNSVRTM